MSRTALIVGLATAAALTVAAPAAAEAGCGKTTDYNATWEVQGEGDRSPLADETVDDLRGVVTQDVQAGDGPDPKEGFFLQAHEPDCDEDTSDGLFVYTGVTPADVAVGDLVELDGATVDEWEGPYWANWPRSETQAECLSGCSVATLEAGHGRPDPVAWDPPADADAAEVYGENREGMYVIVEANVTAMGPTDPYETAPVARGADRVRAVPANGPHGDVFTLDGGSIGDACASHGLPDVKTFDEVPHAPEDGVGVQGAIRYEWATYGIEQDAPEACPSPTSTSPPYAPAEHPLPSVNASALTAATFNLYNLFDPDDDEHKYDDVLTPATYERRLEKLGRSICSPSVLDRPEVLAVQEAENERVLEALATDVEQRCGAVYEVYTREAPDPRSIQAGILWRPANLTLLEAGARQGCSPTDRGITYDNSTPSVECEEGEGYLFNRPPVEAVLRVEDARHAPEVHVVANHFKSKLSSPGCDLENCSTWRVEQAEHVRGLVEERRSGTDAGLVLGDLNARLEDPALEAMAENDTLSNLWTLLEGAPADGQGDLQRYTYIFRGTSTVLDHVLATPGAREHELAIHPRHANADWPASHLGDAEATHRASDHDPVLATVGFPGPLAAPNATFAVDCEKRTCTFDASNATDPAGEGLTYAWELGDGSEATGEVVEHAYEREGTYEVTLEVRDALDRRDTATRTVEPCRLDEDGPTGALPVLRLTLCDTFEILESLR